ncbi:MAG: hypothetical protein AUJ48_02645 [Deltaproteobacteria bacterium CG1_02_45_11]|nr:MAG: hypothetical protein AUJ48_02645 [Deltaproteobacteria bacterium CG1_02_45_11]
MKPWLIGTVCLFIVVPLSWLLLLRLEGEKPQIVLKPTFLSIGASQEFSVTVSDIKSGVRRICISLLKDGREIVILEQDFPCVGLSRGGKVKEETFQVKIEPKKNDISDGQAVLRMVAQDYSWRRWWHGNKTYLEKNVMIDTRPPEIDILSSAHNISQGGAGLVIYQISELCPVSGVYVGENFFPGYSGHFKDSNILMAFFALNYNQGVGTDIFVKATDPAGNNARAGLPHYIREKVFKNDVVNVSDQFLNWKMPEFDIAVPNDSKTPMLDKFLKVNRELRQANAKKIAELGKNTDNVLYWDGVFSRLPQSAPMAGFADQREYKYGGLIIDHQVHLGIDLASLTHSPVPAANRGKVVFTDPLGIYGKTIIIDHGFGLFSMYSHLSGIDVQKEQIVSKGEIIGRTGSTGLAGGDHLHFGIFIHNTFVNPIEWWDAVWIKNNITTKIDEFVKTQNSTAE